MDKAYNFILKIIILMTMIYLLGFVISDDLLINTMKDISSKLTPYTIEILHLR
ncbi:MAG: hypothetical protein KatS3mg094_398 [Candidatus Parcubacteria bacterium]|nr:MAG: hypothetical protein KatS3mg094_398 [Candidatus Parcubacteria bacterium]